MTDTDHSSADKPQRQPSLAGVYGFFFHSWRGRYLGIAVLSIFLLLGAAWMVQSVFHAATAKSVAKSNDRRAFTTQLRDFSMNQVWTAEIALSGYLLVPDENTRHVVHTKLENMLAIVPHLREFGWIKQNPETTVKLWRLEQDIVLLQKAAEQVIEIRSETTLLFPAMPIMLDKMLPAVVDFVTAANEAMAEALDETDDPVQNEIFRLFSESRYSFSQMINAFRLWLVNRQGIFGEPAIAMQAQGDNIQLYSEVVKLFLDKLVGMEEQDLLGLQQSLSLEIMRPAVADWHRYYAEVELIMYSDDWRADAPLLSKNVYPYFLQVLNTLQDLDKLADASSIVDISALGDVAIQITRSIWLLALMGILITIGGFLLFEVTVRRPIGRVVQALKAEASGAGGIAIPDTRTQETRDLISAFDAMRQQVNYRQQRLEAIFDAAAEGIITFDEQGFIENFSQAAEKLFGWNEDEVIGTSIGLLIGPDKREQHDDYLKHFLRKEISRLIGIEGELLGRHKDGTRFPMSLKVSQMIVAGKQLYTALVADISERKAMIERLKSLAEHDALTGMYNRTYFQEELDRVAERVRRSDGEPCALLYIDLDNFKYVNDTLGHAAGDRLLIEVSQILQKRARKSDLIARFGGDEFTVLLYGTTPENAGKVAESCREKLAAYEFRHQGERIRIGCSIGVNILGPATKSAEEALSQADLACHLAKLGGRNQVHTFSQIDAEKVTTMTLDMGWTRRIRDAIEHDRFVLATQPILSTQTSAVEAYEVLIRMLDDDGGMIMPGGFLPVAERFGLIVDIDKWVIVHAIENLTERRKSSPELRYAINISAKTLMDDGVFLLISESLKKYGLDPSALTFEVTETDAIADIAVAENFLSLLQQLGCRTALDDFGSGMSSFAYLRDLPVDFVKIDGQFVRHLANSPVDQAMVKAMSDIAHALGKKTIAEFVEDEETFRLLKAYGVDFAQGYHLGRPEVTVYGKATAINTEARTKTG